ncbi:hypothetical protein ABEB36_008510 [Hypothenemus hampei]|uniref:Cytochrome c oxidase subunit 6C n=1 Tax=Hypothenemus hampei TaxID=57062 RepID=A0ABD1EMQ7_HYPHA
MSGEVTKPLPRPQLRGLLHTQIKRNLIGVGISVIVAGAYVYFIRNQNRKKLYEDFYKNYDIEKEFQRMKKKGLFNSCPADD